MLKKNIYRWHRRLSLIIAVPLVLSASSGFLHPIMTNIRPLITTQGIPWVPIDSSQLRISLQAAADSNHIDSISQVRFVHIDTNWFYQVLPAERELPLYLSTRTGKLLPKGDYLYARYIARLFLEGVGKRPGGKERGEKPTGKEPGERPIEMEPGVEDCCNAATSAVLDAKGSPVLDVIRLTSFDEEYAGINRLLPVYKVSFDRPDSMRVYVETVQDRFALAVDNRRAAFNKIFQYIHTYQWLDFLGKGKQIVIFLLVGLAFLTTLLGIYIFFSSRSKRVPGNGYVRARRNHRYTAIVISLFTLMFTFSGAVHALYKLKEDTRQLYFVCNRFPVGELHFDYARLAGVVRRPITGISLVAMGARHYWQVSLLGKEGADGAPHGVHKDLMRDMQAAAPVMVYLNTTDYRVLPGGEAGYARYLATLFSGHPDSTIMSTTLITKFDRDYNFTDKRLPVWKVSYPVNHHERYYVETTTGSLSVRVDDLDLMESYSFAFFHKHEFLAGFGKSVKDTSTMFWAAAQLLMVAIGLTLYFKYRNRQRKNISPSTNNHSI